MHWHWQNSVLPNGRINKLPRDTKLSASAWPKGAASRRAFALYAIQRIRYEVWLCHVKYNNSNSIRTDQNLKSKHYYNIQTYIQLSGWIGIQLVARWRLTCCLDLSLRASGLDSCLAVPYWPSRNRKGRVTVGGDGLVSDSNLSNVVWELRGRCLALALQAICGITSY